METNGYLLRKDLHNYTGASNLEFNTKIKELISSGRKVHHFGFGQSPFPVPKYFVDALQKYANRHEYLPVQGLPELRRKIIDFHRRYDHLGHFSPDRIVFGAGSKEILFLILHVFGGDILLISPAWTSYSSQVQLAGRNAHVIPTTYENRHIPKAIDIEQVVHQNCKPDSYKLLILNSPNNPTGVVIPDEELKQIAEVCKRNKIIVVSDEIYGRLQFDGQNKSIAKHYPEGTILTSGFSKWASAGGWRTGYGLFPEELLPLYKGVASAGSHTYTCAPAPMQYAIAEALDHQDELNSYMINCRKVLNMCGDYAHRELATGPDAGAIAHKSEAGYYFMPDFEPLRAKLQAAGITTGIQMCDNMLEKANVALMPCDPYYLHTGNHLTTRFCFVNFDGNDALEAIGDGCSVDSIEDQEKFLKKYCSSFVEGVQALKDWIKSF